MRSCWSSASRSVKVRVPIFKSMQHATSLSKVSPELLRGVVRRGEVRLVSGPSGARNGARPLLLSAEYTRTSRMDVTLRMRPGTGRWNWSRWPVIAPRVAKVRSFATLCRLAKGVSVGPWNCHQADAMSASPASRCCGSRCSSARNRSLACSLTSPKVSWGKAGSRVRMRE
eukprot:scaffold111434_cov63-Phaeocystis_antarctica.AAC.2